AIEALVHLFGLSRFERNVLLLCLAPGIDPAFERLYAYVQDDATRKYATPQLALALLSGDGKAWLESKESLMPGGQLRRFRLLTPDDTHMPHSAGAAALRISERVADYILGVNRIEDRIADLLSPVASAPLAGPLIESMDRLASWIEKQG